MRHRNEKSAVTYQGYDNHITRFISNAINRNIALGNTDSFQAIRETECLIHVAFNLIIDVLALAERKGAQFLVLFLGICAKQVAEGLCELWYGSARRFL